MVPLPMLWGTRLKLVKKVAATFVFGAGIFVLVCSLLKTVFVITVSLVGAIGTPSSLSLLGRARLSDFTQSLGSNQRCTTRW